MLQSLKVDLASLTVKKVANITWEQVEVIAKDKMVDLNAFTVEAAMKMVAGTARSMGITVSGNAPWNN